MPSLKPLWDMDRRTALKGLAGAMAAIMTGCGRPEEEIIPYADMPEGLVAGEPARYATTLSLSGYGRGFIAIATDGRPIKVEGNSRHPFSLGATDIFAESEVLSLYDPDRAKTVRHRDQIATWDDFHAAWNAVPASARIGLVTGRIVSPTTLLRIAALKTRWPQLRWYRYEPVHDDAERAGSRLAFGRVLTALPNFAKADVVVCLDSDSLGPGPDQLRTARDYAARREAHYRQRVFVAEPAWTLTGAAADDRLAATPDIIAAIGCFIANQLGAHLPAPELPAPAAQFAARISHALLNATGRVVVLTGPAQPPEFHALCHWLNGRLNAPLEYLPPIDSIEEDHAAALSALADDLHNHRIDALVIADANPVYDAPDTIDIAQALSAVPFTAHLGLHADETAAACSWNLPLSHVLESWGDARALDGTASLVQPLIRRLYDTRTRDELLSLLANETLTSAYDLTRATWQNEDDFDTWWRQALHDGVIGNSTVAPQKVPPARLAAPAVATTAGLTLALSPHPSVWDGRFANNAWLQECPTPFTKEVWGNAIAIAPEDAARFGIADGDTVDLTIAGTTITAPSVIMAGQALGTVAASWGQGRTNAGRIGNGIGARYAGLGERLSLRRFAGARIEKSTKVMSFRSTQGHTSLNGRTEDLFPLQSLAKPIRAPESKTPPSLLPIPPRGEYAWAMVIDTDVCIGCNACVVACQAENNVPIVGPEEISQGRDMHWLRVDSYAQPQGEHLRRGFQPVPCMQCELAPCEPVCPVEASVHDRQGLNVQVYNRCIGTRFCEANCPYKVRRFNWFAYAGEQAYAGEGEALKAQHNPDVSMRARGVMEKCNYCLQRVMRARRAADRENRKVAEGEVVTACQAACPTRAIHFGDLNRADSDVTQLRSDARHYTLLAELNTRPRTTYLKRTYNDRDEPA